MSRIWKAVRCLFFVGMLVETFYGYTPARAAQDSQSAAMSILHADSEPYHLEWNGREGTFSQDALGAEPARRAPLVFLHADPGPKGYSKYLAWFLARDGESFSLLWCYLNDTGQEFYCWLYRYPANQLTSLRFTGRYRFNAPAEPVSAVPAAGFAARQTPHYAGPDFSYGNWTRRSGTLAKLELRPTRASTFATPITERKGQSGPGNGSGDPAVSRTLEMLRAYPLQELHVPGGNGWHAGGWRELHALALDAANDPYYLILYSYSTRGYVIDLKRAQTYVTDFGQKVVFSQAPSVFGGADDQVAGPPELRVPRNTRYEVTFTATGRYTNPCNEVLLDIDLRTPTGKSITVPGFWDGGDTWRVRIAPTISGIWTWRTRSSDAGLNGQEGTFNCASEHVESKGFLTVNSAYSYRHHFAMPDGVPFLPVYASYPVNSFVGRTEGTAAVGSGEHPFTIDSGNLVIEGLTLDTDAKHSLTAGTGKLTLRFEGASIQAAAKDGPVVRATYQPDAASEKGEAYSDFQHTIDGLAALGVNRLIGGYLIDTAQFQRRSQRNEGGAPFTDYDPDRLNPAYFQAMDRRVAYANDKGIAPDLGVGLLDADLSALLSDAQIRRLWRYVLARYSSYNVCWTLFGRPIGKPEPDGAADLVDSLVRLTARYDPVGHPLTTVMPGAAETTAPGANPALRRRMPSPAPPPISIMPDPPSQEVDNGFIHSPAGLPLGPSAVSPVVSAPVVKLNPLPAWMNVIVFNGGPVEEVTAAYNRNQPVVLYDRSAPSSPDAARHRLWKTRMSGGYWSGDFSSPSDAGVLDQPATLWSAYCGRLFARTRFWRLAPHNEMLGAMEESAFERRRRQQALKAAARQAALHLPDAPPQVEPLDHAPGQSPTPTPPAPIYVLADPSWEYVVYFEKGGDVTLDLLEATGRVAVVWFNPRNGQFLEQDPVMGGAFHTFRAPDTNDWALYLSRR